MPGNFIVVPDTSLLVVGETRRLAVEATLDLKAYEGRAEWASSNSTVATVDAAGYVRAIGEGEAIITVTTGGRSASAPVYVQRYSKSLRFAQVTTGIYHACGLTTDGAVYCWGDGSVGQLGTTSPTDQCETTSTDRHGNPFRFIGRCSAVPVHIASSELFTSITATDFGTCAVNAAGSLFCWGVYQDPSRFQSAIPLATGGQHTYVRVSPPCALTSRGEAYCWGPNYNGSLGTGSITSPSVASPDDPVLVGGGHLWKAIDARVGSACGIATDGITYCWGLNNSQQLGVAPDTLPPPCRVDCRASPTPLARQVPLTQISIGGPINCGLTAEGEAYCWGYRYGSANSGWQVPNSLGSTRYSTIAAGNYESCAISVDRSTFCWGSGVGSAPALPASADPASVVLPVTMSTVGKPGWGACGIGTDGLAYCWGASRFGMLGDGGLPAMGIRAEPDSFALPRIGKPVFGQR